MNVKKSDYIPLIKSALNEDLKNTGDVTSEAIFKDQKASFILLSKDQGILCGSDIFSETFKLIDKSINVKFLFKDKNPLKKGDVIAQIKGKAVNILKGERTALNFISHLSGIATKTNNFVKLTKDKIKILDTRKTIPNLRILQKYAVYCGGGTNHRMGLFDMVLIKDNHIDAAGGINNAVNSVRKKWDQKYKIEVETRNLNEVEEAVLCKVDRIMLDNMTINEMSKATQLINNKIEIEVSGNIDIKKIKKLLNLNIDFISIGGLTHTIEAFDFSLKEE
jgi:nicotinate-nucleotide pyrophosphorylase (carboxylating)